MKNKILDDFNMDTNFLEFGLFLAKSGIFRGSAKPMRNEKVPPIQNLNDGFTLVAIDTIKDNNLNYSHLYKDGVKISDEIFRAGGFCNGFKDGYCSLLSYTIKGDKIINDNNTVIVDTTGKIVLQQTALDYIYHLGGVLAKKSSMIYNLLTGEIIIECNNTIASQDFLFVENKYNKKIELGVYKISYKTGEVEFFK